MQMSVAIGPYGSYDPVETPKPLWGSPGAELSTWTTFQFCCETAIHGHALRHGPPELYSAIQRYTLYSYTAIQLYSAIHYRLYNLYNTPLLVCPPRATANARGMPAKVAKQGCRHILNMCGEIWWWVSRRRKRFGLFAPFVGFRRVASGKFWAFLLGVSVIPAQALAPSAITYATSGTRPAAACRSRRQYVRLLAPTPSEG